MPTLGTYKGLKVFTDTPTGLGGKTINDNFKTIADKLQELEGLVPDLTIADIDGLQEALDQKVDQGGSATLTNVVADSVQADSIQANNANFVGITTSGISVEGNAQVNGNLDVTGVITGNASGLTNLPSHQHEISDINNLQETLDQKADVGHVHPTTIFYQSSPSLLWTITHGLDKYPSVSVVDSAGTKVNGVVKYINSNQLTVEFGASFSGRAYLN